MSAGPPAHRRVAVAVWLLLVVSVAIWPLAAGIGWALTALACLPLLLPLPGLLRGSLRALRGATLALAPLLAIAVTEYLVRPPARPWAGISLALAIAAFAAILAALRAVPRA
jgi:uncharacterized membrane protein